MTSLHSSKGLDLAAGVLVQTFCDEGLGGSPQQLHFFADNAGRDDWRKANLIEDDRDHSYVVRRPDGFAVAWANRLGPIQLCGSAAFALGWLLMKSALPVGRIKLVSDEFSLDFGDGTDPCLNLPVRHARSSAHTATGWRGVAVHQGIYLVELADLSALTSDDCHTQLMSALAGEDVHALCACHWDSHGHSGYLRYFVPRYGRDEDWVTGSVHSLLGPWIRQRYGVSTQRWHQLSVSPGRVSSQVTAKTVVLRGECQLGADFSWPQVRGALGEWLGGL